MARVFKDSKGNNVQVTRSEMLRVSPDAIVMDWDRNGRSAKPDFANLVESIRSVGQLQPVLARKNEEGQLELVAGFCRVEAIKQINKERAKGEEETPVTVIVQSLDAEEAFLRNLQENMARNETSPMDDAHNLRRLTEEFGKSVKEAAALLGKTETWVRQTMKLLTLDSKTQSLLHKREMAWSAGVMLAGVEESKRKEIVAELDEEAQKKFEEGKARAEKAAEKAAKKAVKKADSSPATAPEGAKGVDVPTDVKVPAKRIETKKVAKKVREAGSTAAIATPNRSAIKSFFEGMTGPGETELTRKTALLVLDFMAGKVSDQAAEKRLRKLLSGVE